LMLADLPIGGGTRKVIMQASKNGFFYVLDRQTGQFISAKAFVNGITWATGINPETGRPQESPSAHDGWQAVLVSPSPGGGHNWYPMAFHPATGLVYVPARENSVFLAAPDKNWKSNPTLWNRGEDAAYDEPVKKKALASPPMTGHLIAGIRSSSMKRGVPIFHWSKVAAYWRLGATSFFKADQTESSAPIAPRMARSFGSSTRGQALWLHPSPTFATEVST